MRQHNNISLVWNEKLEKDSKNRKKDVSEEKKVGKSLFESVDLNLSILILIFF